MTRASRPKPKGIGRYRSGRGDVSQRAEEILRHPVARPHRCPPAPEPAPLSAGSAAPATRGGAGRGGVSYNARAAMIDLSRIPDSVFASALESNLRRLAAPRKIHSHFLAAVREHLDADAAWLFPHAAEGGLEGAAFEGDRELCDEDLVRAFAERRRPRLPKNVLLSPLKLYDRHTGVVGVARRGRDFDLGTGRVLNRLAALLGQDLERREQERLDRVLDRIREKVVGELRPRDLAYQILDGLLQLVHYDHSAALLIHEPEAGSLRVDAEKVVWTKTKSAFVGHEIPVAGELLEALRQGPEVRVFDVAERGREEDGLDERFHRLLSYHRGHGIPEALSTLYAPLFFEDELLGLLKIAAHRRPAFDRHDRAVVSRFLPAARVALRNAQMKAALENQAMQAEVRASLVTLARAVAHDVNGAIGTILLLAEQAREEARAGAVDAAALEEDLGDIIDKARLCKRIFSNMLRVASARSGSGPVDVNRVIREMLPMLEAQVGARAIRITADLAKPLAAVRSSRHHLERIVWNLVTNAIEAISRKDGRGGRIELTTRPDGGQGVVLTVRDDGPGIEPELLPKVKEPFFSTKEGGTGLGLSICRSLAWQYGGGLEIESAPGEGTRVRVHLPYADTGADTGMDGEGEEEA